MVYVEGVFDLILLAVVIWILVKNQMRVPLKIGLIMLGLAQIALINGHVIDWLGLKSHVVLHQYYFLPGLLVKNAGAALTIYTYRNILIDNRKAFVGGDNGTADK